MRSTMGPDGTYCIIAWQRVVAVCWPTTLQRGPLSLLVLVMTVFKPLTSYLSTRSEVAFTEAWLVFPTRPCVILTHSSGEEAVFPLCVFMCASACRRVVELLDEWFFCGPLFPCTICPHDLDGHLSPLCWYVCVIWVLHLSRSLWFLYPTAGLNLFTVSSTNLGTTRCPRPSTEASVLPPLPCAKVHSPSLAGINLVHHALLS